MHEHGLAKELWPQLEQIARAKGLRKVTRLSMTVGLLHGASAEMLSHSFAHTFEGTCFEGVEMNIIVVDPGQQLAADEGGPATASGWEILITRIEGDVL